MSTIYPIHGISIHALLAESDGIALHDLIKHFFISIHALLAESDQQKCGDGKAYVNFYPRSPCGERLRWARSRRRRSEDFYPRSPCGERRHPDAGGIQGPRNFYPRSPCGERPGDVLAGHRRPGFLSTLSLRRATRRSAMQSSVRPFLSTLSLRRATFDTPAGTCRSSFLSTLSLRRATVPKQENGQAATISIHALLAESDQLQKIGKCDCTISIHALLAESDPWPAPAETGSSISIHALLAESDLVLVFGMPTSVSFLSTLSLRRATVQRGPWPHQRGHFYPRSPCGERRPVDHQRTCIFAGISIHALLAESDLSIHNVTLPDTGISIHALLAESDVTGSESQKLILHFYPRSPCGERHPESD